MEPTEILVTEHRIIRCGLSVLSAIVVRAEQGRPISVQRARTIVEFFRRYGVVHREKEEGILFPALAEVGLPRTAGPVAQAVQEHELTESLLEEMRELTQSEIDGSAGARFTQLAHRFLSLERKHLDREERMIFPLVRQKLPDEVRRRLTDQFDQHRLRHAAEQTRCVALLEPLLELIAA